MSERNETTELNSHIWRFAAGHATTAIARTPLASAHSYYRSKTFVANAGTNRLIAAASALLSLATRLKETIGYSDIETLYQHLCHEISAFETLARKEGFRSETTLVARYILCTMLDECILQTPWGKFGEWDNHRLLFSFQKEAWGGERFFLILDRLSDDPAIHVDLLELIYLCLTLGYEGKYRLIENGNMQLEQIVEQLYRIIRYQRGDVKKELLIYANDTGLSTHAPAQHFPYWLMVIFTVVILLVTYVGLGYLSGLAATPVYEQLLNLQQYARDI